MQNISQNLDADGDLLLAALKNVCLPYICATPGLLAWFQVL
jgi:hypothetical protein